MGKVNDFVMIGELGVVLAASSDKSLHVFAVEQDQEGSLTLRYVSKLAKESSARVL